MRIGIDLDGVVFDSEKDFRIYSEIYDMVDLKQNSKTDNRKLGFQERFNWTQEETDGFLKKYHKKVILDSNFMPGAKEVLKMLKQDGHILVLITARGTLNKDMIKLTEDRLKQNDMDIFDKYFWAVKNKGEICEKENIELMIDDSTKHIQTISELKIKTIYFKDAPSYDLEDNEYIKTLYNWGEIYRYINEIK